MSHPSNHQKTNVVRTLEAAGLNHTVAAYEVDETALGAPNAAAKLGVEAESLFKTLLCRGDRTGVVVFCIPGNATLDLKKAATASGNKKVEMVRERELRPLTGYIRGGCSPIGMTHSYPTYIEESATLFEGIYVSAGVRGLQVRIGAEDLAELIGAGFADLL